MHGEDLNNNPSHAKSKWNSKFLFSGKEKMAMLNDKDDEIYNYMKKVLETYSKIRGRHKNEFKEKFWDAVVLSSSDQSQKLAFEKQIINKQQCFALPLGVPFHVFSDPPNSKIGCGGSTMLVLENLLEIYGQKLWKMCILFIPAGGYSQRLPSHSVLGKLFAPVPIINKEMVVYEMIDLILAVYLPFLKKMLPGIFLASSDAIISFYLSTEDVWSFECSGFIALAHPSTVEIAKNHGVYVLSDLHSKNPTFMSSCIQVLQKPSKSLMEEKGAVIKGGIEREGNEIVYTDSAFYFDMDVAKKLLDFYQKIKPLQCELSSYGDFLQPLGLHIDKNFIHNEDSQLSSLKMQLFQLLYGTPLHVLVLKKSCFYHFGTMEEYANNYCISNGFSQHFPCENFVCSTIFPHADKPTCNTGTIICSLLHPACFIDHSSIVEYCDFQIPLHISKNCIISNCVVSKSNTFNEPLQIPANILLHTIPLKHGYVTVCFNFNDDIKKSCKLDDSLNLCFLNTKLKDINSKCMYLNKFFSAKENDHVSLWHAKLFPICDSMEKSFLTTLAIVYEVLGIHVASDLSILSNSLFISMDEVLKHKNEDAMLIYRKNNCQKISHVSKSGLFWE